MQTTRTPFPPPNRRSLAYNLREFVLVNNTALVGRLPDEAAGLSKLRRVGLLGTSMSCVPNEIAIKLAAAAAATNQSGGSPEPPPPPRCAEGELLPCFLEFSKYTVPRSDDSRMACRPIARRSADAVASSCPSGVLSSEADASAEVLQSQWDIPPSYYQYQGCHCLTGWRPEWSRGGTVLRCKADQTVLPPWMWVLVALGAVLGLLAASLMVLGSRWALFKSRWVREAELKRKRRLGMPKEGSTFCVVVTDIEGYSSEWILARGLWVVVGGGWFAVCNAYGSKVAHLRPAKPNHPNRRETNPQTPPNPPNCTHQVS
jgi:hypothetical protein